MRLSLPALLAVLWLSPRSALCADSPPGDQRIAGIELEGELLDSRAALLAVMGQVAAPGQPLVADAGSCEPPEAQACAESGEGPSAPASGPASQPALRAAAARAPAPTVRPRGTRCGLMWLLRRLNYVPEVTIATGPEGATVHVKVRPQRMVRKIYITGNWPLFEEEILRLVRFRPSQPLPEGCRMEAEVAASTRRIREFLGRQGYFDGKVDFAVWEGSRPAEVDLHIRLDLGRRYRVDGVSAEGTFALPEPELGRLFHHRAWYTLGLTEEPFTTSRLKEDLDRVVKRFHEAGYPGARVRSDFSPERSIDRQAGEVRLGLKVHEGRHVDVSFTGNRKLTDETLREALTLFTAGSYDEYEIEESARRIHELYQSKGYFQAQVTWERRRQGERGLAITFQITEGPRLKVRRIELSGNRRFGADTLRDVVQTRVYPWIGVIGLGQGGYVTDLQLRQDVERLTTFYQAHGFEQVKVTGAVTRGRETDALVVRFAIDEGPQITVGEVDVQFLGAHERTRKQVLRGLTLKPGAPFTATGLKLDGALILRGYASAGHPYVALHQTIVENHATHERSVLWMIDEGPRVHVGEILVRGNFKTWRHVILNEIPFRPGDRFDLGKAERAERNLRTLGLFRTVRLTWLGLEEKRDPVHLLVQVEERYDVFAAVETGGGFSTDTVAGTAAFANATVSQGNLFGLGYNLSLQAEFTYSFTLGTWSRNFGGSFVDPRWFGKRLRLEIGAYWRVEDTIRLGRLETYGTSVSVSREFYPGLSGVVHYDLKRVLRNENLVRLPGPLEDIERVQVPTDIGSVGLALVFDRRDHPLVPTRGYRLSLGVQWASRYLGPALYGRGEDFIKLHGGFQGFLPLGGGLVLVQGLRYDHGFPLGGASMLPKIERFYAGGDTTVRGFEQDRMWTELVEQTIPPLAPGAAFYTVPQGGNIRAIQNLELSFPLWKKSVIFGLPIYGSVFLDSGILVNSFDGFSLRDIRFSAGVAFLRLITPVGALSFEFATPLNPRPGDIRPGDTWKSWPWNWPGRLHFNFGFAF